jgi:hypothetical protein
MSELATLFKEPETWLGVFYPKHYVIATLPSFDAAKSANQALRRGGFDETETRAVAGTDLLEYFDELHVQNGFLGDLMAEFSRLIGTEAAFADKDVSQAHHGAGFVAVHCSTEAEAQRILDIIRPFNPVAMQWYRAGAIRSLI